MEDEPESAPHLEAIDRVIYFLDRGAAPAQKVRAFQRGRAILADYSLAEITQLVATSSLTSLEGIGPSIGSVVSAAVDGRPNDYLDKLAASSVVPIGEGIGVREQIRGDCHSHSTWSDGGAAVKAMAESARALGHEYLVVTDHSERLTVAHGLSADRLARTPEVRSVSLLSSSPVEVDGMPGHEIVARCVGRGGEGGVVMFQTIALDGDRYYLVQGEADLADADRLIPEFREVASGLRRTR